MNGLDIVILVVFFASTIIGAFRGFTKEILSLFSWGGSISLSYIFLPIGRSFVSPYIANPMMADGAAYFGLFIVFLVLLSIVASIIAGYIHESSFRGLDHSLGFGFGIVRGVVVICAAELVFSVFSPRQTQSYTIQSARFIPMVRKGADTLLQILPNSLRTAIIEQAIKVENQVGSKISNQLKQGVPSVMPGGSSDSLGGMGAGIAGALGNFAPSNPGHNTAQEGQGYSGNTQTFSFPQGGQQPVPQGQEQPTAPRIIQPQMMPQQGQPPQSSMVVPPQQGQVPQGQVPQNMPPSNTPQPMMGPSQGGGQMSGQGGETQGGATTPPPTQGLVQSAMPQDTQSTVAQLSKLTPVSSPKEDSGYTQGQRDDMNRLFQAADGDE